MIKKFLMTFILLICTTIIPCFATVITLDCEINSENTANKYYYTYIINLETKKVKALYGSGETYIYPLKDVSITNDFIKLYRHKYVEGYKDYDEKVTINRHSGYITIYRSNSFYVDNGYCKKIQKKF